MTELPEHKKRIARNTMYLYCRKVVMILIGLYASRLLLERLGDDGFGLYGLIGSVIVLFEALSGLFTASIQRYVNVAKATGHPEDVQKVFSIGMTIQLMLAAVFFVAVEIGGFFLIPGLNITPGLEADAWWVFQISLVTSVVGMLTVPYYALIVANERLGVYSVFSLVESVLRLGAVILLGVWDSDRVVWYAALLLVVSLVLRLANSVYCSRAFGSEARYRRVHDRKMFREMTFFAVWTFLGGFGSSIVQSGINFVLNIFGGLKLNTSRTVAVQIEGNAIQFSRDINVGFRPRSIIEYARGAYDEYYSLMGWNTKVGFFVSSLLCAVFCCLAEPVIRLWLGTVPEYSVVFAQIIMVYTVVQALYDPLDTFFRATGKMKRAQITEFCIMMTVVPVAWALLAAGAPFYTVFAVHLAVEIINYVVLLFVARSQLGFPLGRYVRDVYKEIIPTLVVLGGCYLASKDIIPADLGTWRTLALLPVLTVLFVVVEFLILFTAPERAKLLALVAGGWRRRG